jgi:hypothetical protein
MQRIQQLLFMIRKQQQKPGVQGLFSALQLHPGCVFTCICWVAATQLQLQLLSSVASMVFFCMQYRRNVDRVEVKTDLVVILLRYAVPLHCCCRGPLCCVCRKGVFQGACFHEGALCICAAMMIL